MLASERSDRRILLGDAALARARVLIALAARRGGPKLCHPSRRLRGRRAASSDGRAGGQAIIERYPSPLRHSTERRQRCLQNASKDAFEKTRMASGQEKPRRSGVF
jgi:hypothetical protein